DHESYNPEVEAAVNRRETANRKDGETVGEDPDDDRRDAVQRIGREPDRRGKARAPVFRDVEAGDHADRYGEGPCQTDQDQRADDGVREAAPHLSDRLGIVEEKAPLERA